ncbi:RING finger protein [Streptomyces asiaticus]|uniref:hypothetical protein n=1 Tax=Streptomyces asiaticus TaxID=114695 RepID=UPI003803475F
MTTITHRQLINDAIKAEDTLIATSGDDPHADIYVHIPHPGRGKKTNWWPATAYATAGHIAQHWNSTTAPLTIEDGQFNRVWLRMEATPMHPAYRLEATQGEGTEPVTRELCGHTGCREIAPAGPGSRCPKHFTDDTPTGKGATYWAELAATAWAETNSPRGEAVQLADNVRNGIVIGGLEAGMTKHRLHQITGIARTTIDRIIEPQPLAFDGSDDDEDAPA